MRVRMMEMAPGPPGQPAAALRDPASTPIVVVWTPRGVQIPPALDSALRARGVNARHVDDQYAAVAEVCRLANAQPVSAQVRSGTARPEASATRSPGGGLGLLLVDPQRLDQTEPGRVDEVVGVLERSAPRAVCWTYADGRKPVMQRYTPSQASASDAGTGRESRYEPVPGDPLEVRVRSGSGASWGAAARAHGQAGGGPVLRLAGEGPGAAAIDDGGSDGAGSENLGGHGPETSPEADTRGPESRDFPGNGQQTNPLPTTRELLSSDELAMLLGRDDDMSGGTAR